MIEMPSATAVGLSPEVLVQSSLEQRIGVNQQGPVLRECFIKKAKDYWCGKVIPLKYTSLVLPSPPLAVDAYRNGPHTVKSATQQSSPPEIYQLVSA